MNDMAKYDLAVAEVEKDLVEIEKECSTKIDRSRDVLTQLRELLVAGKQMRRRSPGQHEVDHVIERVIQAHRFCQSFL